MSKLPWGHTSRHCTRCGKVGPRINDCSTARGWVHYYCLDEKEKAQRRKDDREFRKAALKGSI